MYTQIKRLLPTDPSGQSCSTTSSKSVLGHHISLLYALGQLSYTTKKKEIHTIL